MSKFFCVVFILFLAVGTSNGQIFHKAGSGNAERGLSAKSAVRKKRVKVIEPRAVVKAKRKQAAEDRKLKKEYKKFIKWSRKRTVDIQTPEVQARMKQDKKDITYRNKVKKKITRSGSKKAGRKYR